MDKRTCSIDGCDKPVKNRGWCSMHYARWRTHGDPMKTKKFFDPDAAIQARTRVEGDCTVYTTSHDHKGYAYIKVQGVLRKVHRYAWERDRGPIPEGAQVDHTCYNKACYNVDHLRLANTAENVRNLNGAKRNNKSTGIRNVYRQNGGRFKVRVGCDGVDHYFGAFDTIEEASVAADRARILLFGEYAGKGGVNGGTTARGEKPSRAA